MSLDERTTDLGTGKLGAGKRNDSTVTPGNW
jgi:hypothetical protein